MSTSTYPYGHFIAKKDFFVYKEFDRTGVSPIYNHSYGELKRRKVISTSPKFFTWSDKPLRPIFSSSTVIWKLRVSKGTRYEVLRWGGTMHKIRVGTAVLVSQVFPKKRKKKGTK